LSAKPLVLMGLGYLYVTGAQTTNPPGWITIDLWKQYGIG